MHSADCRLSPSSASRLLFSVVGLTGCAKWFRKRTTRVSIACSGSRTSCGTRVPTQSLETRLRDPQDLVRLQADPPARMRQAVFHRQPRIAFALRAIHRLQEEVTEIELFVLLRLGPGLRKNELQLVTGRK